MSHAASLLLTTGNLVKNIAFELGFETLSTSREPSSRFTEYRPKVSLSKEDRRKTNLTRTNEFI